jgi:hypothetical protein
MSRTTVTDEARNAAEDAPERESLTAERLLSEAAELIARGWCRTSLAQDGRGRRVEPWAKSACCWSPLGALLAVWVHARGGDRDALEMAYAELALATGGRPEEWNAAPWRTSWHVHSAFARARENVPAARRQLRTRSTEMD